MTQVYHEGMMTRMKQGESVSGGRAIVVLHNIRSAYNVGAIFRTADAVGVSRMYLVGYTPTPVDRFGRSDPTIAKTALGAERSVPWEHVEHVENVIGALKQEGYAVVAVEQDSRARDYKDFVPMGPTAFVYGNEVDGVPKEVCDMADVVIALPMRGSKESLNVSVAAGITLFRALDS